MDQPRTGHTTPRAEQITQLLGGASRHEGVVISRDEKKHLDKLYGFVEEQPQPRPPRPTAPDRADYTKAYEYSDALKEYERRVKCWESWEDPRAFFEAGATRNMFRHASHDGLRIMAWLAKFVEAGSDPLKTVVRMAIDSGCDVDPSDVTWAMQDDDECGEDET